MPSLELQGFPTWAEYEDLKAVVDGTGQKCSRLQIVGKTAIVYFETAAAAGIVAATLNDFEFTPGWPLQARAIPDPLPQRGCKTAAQGSESKLRKGTGKGAGERLLMSEGVLDVAFPEGRIDGWFAQESTIVFERGWGHLQSAVFEGNVPFRPAFSPLIKGQEFAENAPVSFEIVTVADGTSQAVNLALCGQEDQLEKADTGDRPWEDLAKFDFECYVDSNKKWLGKAGESFLRGMDPVDIQHVIKLGPLTGVRDPCKVIAIRLRKAKEAIGEIEPYEVRKAKKYPWTDEEWEAWNAKWGGGSSSSKRKEKDDTWGNEDGCGCFFGALVPDCDEKALRAFAESVGTVKFVKLFIDHATGKSKNCGKVFYETPEMAERAVKELHRVEFMGRLTTVEILGDEITRVKRLKGPEKKEEDPEDVPILLDHRHFYFGQPVQEKIDICYQVFENLLATHDAEATGKGLAWMVRGLFREMNDLFAGDNDAKFQVIKKFKYHQWFWDNKQQVKWQASQERINLSKVSPNAKMFAARQRGEDPSTAVASGFVQAAKQLDSTMAGVWDSSTSSPKRSSAVTTTPASPVFSLALPAPTKPKEEEETEDKWGPPRPGDGKATVVSSPVPAIPVPMAGGWNAWNGWKGKGGSDWWETGKGWWGKGKDCWGHGKAGMGGFKGKGWW